MVVYEIDQDEDMEVCKNLLRYGSLQDRGYGSLRSQNDFPVQIGAVEITQHCSRLVGRVTHAACRIRYGYLPTNPGLESWPKILT